MFIIPKISKKKHEGTTTTKNIWKIGTVLLRNTQVKARMYEHKAHQLEAGGLLMYSAAFVQKGLDKYNYKHILIVMKTEYLNELPEHWIDRAEILRALGDTTRQRILLLFEPEEELSIKDIADLFPCSRTNIVHHIEILERAKIMSRTKSGRDVLLRLNKDVLIDALENVLTYIKLYA